MVIEDFWVRISLQGPNNYSYICSGFKVHSIFVFSITKLHSISVSPKTNTKNFANIYALTAVTLLMAAKQINLGRPFLANTSIFGLNINTNIFGWTKKGYYEYEYKYLDWYLQIRVQVQIFVKHCKDA